jgi:hypothetical protein
VTSALALLGVPAGVLLACWVRQEVRDIRAYRRWRRDRDAEPLVTDVDWDAIYAYLRDHDDAAI